MQKTILHKGNHNHSTLDKVEIKDQGRTVIAPEPFKINHEEHETLDIPQGDYEHRGVVEAVPFEQEIREVAD